MFPKRLTQRAITAVLSLNKCSMATINGRASSNATNDFIEKSSLKMRIRLNQSNLIINPIIHGSPRHFHVTDNDYYNTLAKRAILINRSNCLVVYDNKRGKPWALDGLGSIITENNLLRENIVTIANLGLAGSSYELYGRLADAVKLTGLQQIDIALFEVRQYSSVSSLCNNNWYRLMMK